MSCKLSIITPVFNGIRFIESCINNIIQQNCPDAEHIIVDGGSTDGTVEIIKAYAERYSHIRWTSGKDEGQSDAMNKGIRMARGDILGFLNVDDFYEKNVLNRIIELFKTLSEPTLLVGNCHRWNDAGEIYEENKPAKLGITDLMLGWNINPFPVNPSQYFYHKSLHQKIGTYNMKEHFTLDIDFLIRAVQGAHVTYRDEFWGNYRFIEGTKTFQDMQQDRCSQRFADLLQRYEKNLPYKQRLLIQLKRSWHEYLNSRVILLFLYFIREPKSFSKKLFHKLIKAFDIKR